jgi:hypothetical protein
MPALKSPSAKSARRTPFVVKLIYTRDHRSLQDGNIKSIRTLANQRLSPRNPHLLNAHLTAVRTNAEDLFIA